MDLEKRLHGNHVAYMIEVNDELPQQYSDEELELPHGEIDYIMGSIRSYSDILQYVNGAETSLSSRYVATPSRNIASLVKYTLKPAMKLNDSFDPEFDPESGSVDGGYSVDIDWDVDFDYDI